MMQIQNLMMCKIKISVNGRTVEIDPTNVVTLDDSGRVLYQ